ncbi:Uncharacterised protein [Corynebacterium ulcerans]|uniref:Uncharacterized protein n=1 Tax=Corynebacterium ulcerans TaxID=65058 RepID=A0ABD7MWN7_CORUL|nr:Uncharacterised protein [Corynebacterium ulcerans]SQG52669.1 Uncharacterised protein [Corynebacterium ulcerans]SQH03003.1 Uncharacterised protein [Corynebacterium ulcerans]
MMELPPHTRRKAHRYIPTRIRRGTTSAYAEKRIITNMTDSGDWNYLRIRGEKKLINGTISVFTELPPHTRRKAAIASRHSSTGGTTSAYAEKRLCAGSAGRQCRNYLRIRGEKNIFVIRRRQRQELPPHTRRKDVWGEKNHQLVGTTSAYAEKRSNSARALAPERNYLRIRGEKTK